MNTIVKTQSGKVRGTTVDGVNAFKGIPYAAPPFGANRFHPPRPVQPWTGVRDALNFGPKSPQPPYPPSVKLLLPPELTTSGTDCLSLNIWAPADGPTGKPVMVWIPGGVFGYHATGASPWYDGSRFARDGIVCVTINYRVGADGFLFLGEGNANRGLLDQIAALEWVRQNIAEFGGDPGKVTVFGESAGAMSVGTLLSMPCAQGLFRRAIAQSGAAHHLVSKETAQLITRRVAMNLGVDATREGLAGVPIECLLLTQLELETELTLHPDPERWGEAAIAGMLWQPTVDGDIIPARPIDRVSAGACSDIDIMVGTNIDEHRLFLAPSGAIDQITYEVLTNAIAAYGLPVEPSMASYRKAHPNGIAGDLLAALQTDWYWRMPAIRLAEAHVNHASATYMYEFAWPSPQFDGRLGACHALEIPYVFDTLGDGTKPLLGSEPPQALADKMHSAWVAFAHNSRPGWPRYDLINRSTMRFNIESEIVDDPRSYERTLWEGKR